MGEILTLAEIYSRFDAEWVLLDEPQTTEDLEIQSGKVLAHSKDRDEVYRKAVELHPKRCAVLFTGTIPDDMVIVRAEVAGPPGASSSQSLRIHCPPVPAWTGCWVWTSCAGSR